MIELLVACSVIAVLMVATFWAYKTQIIKGRDGKRKADLKKIQTVFEDYLNDRRFYPAVSEVSNTPPIICNKTFPPYIPNLPCDPLNSSSYHYYYLPDATRRSYKIYAKLENENDQAILEVGCSPTAGCPGQPNYNYWIGSPNASL